MPNMGYCRFQNTYRDLQDCYEHLWDDELSFEEQRHRDFLVELCKEIAEETEDE